MNQQELIWLKLPFSNLEGSKIRPAVIVSNNAYNKKSKDLVVCSVTSKLRQTPYNIRIEGKNLLEGELPITSMIRSDKILQIEKGLVIKKFAKLDNKTFDRVTNKITSLVKRV